MLWFCGWTHRRQLRISDSFCSYCSGKAERRFEVRSSSDKRLFQECDGSGLHRSLTGFSIIVSGDKNDRDLIPCGREMALELQPIHARHSHVNDETRCLTQLTGLGDSADSSLLLGSQKTRSAMLCFCGWTPHRQPPRYMI